MKQVEATTTNQDNVSRTPARIITILWALFNAGVVIFFVPLAYLLGGPPPPDFVWFALYLGSVIVVASIPFKWERLGGVILVTHGALLFLLFLGFAGNSFLTLICIAPIFALPQVLAGVLFIITALYSSTLDH